MTVQLFAEVKTPSNKTTPLSFIAFHHFILENTSYENREWHRESLCFYHMALIITSMIQKWAEGLYINISPKKTYRWTIGTEKMLNITSY